MRVAPHSPLLGRVLEDATQFRAMFGALSLLLPVSGLVLGAAAAVETGASTVPPPLVLLMLIAVIAIFDALAGLLAGAVYAGAILFAGGFVDTQPPDTWHGVLVVSSVTFVWVALPLIGSAIRPFRRLAPDSARHAWDRGGDALIAGLLCAWITYKLLGSFDNFAGQATGIPEHARAASLTVLAAVVARVVLEELAFRFYPQRLDTVENDETKTPQPTRLAATSGSLFRIGVVCFIGWVFVGSVWELWVGTALLTLPLVLAPFEGRIARSELVRRLMPQGLVEILVLMLTAFVLISLLTAGSTPEQAVRLGFLVACVPPAAIGVLGLVAGESTSPTRSWPRELVGLAVLVAVAMLALQGWDY
ncbi:MAG: hypothetical protein WB767_13740 [Nocardioides sp.]